MNITIDSGNSSTKVGIFEEGGLSSLTVVKNIDNLATLLPKEKDAQVIVSSVNISHTHILPLLKGFRKVISLDYLTPIPLTNRYESPETLGMDRLAAAVGSRKFIKEGTCLIIDAGSCVTYDLVDAKDNYQGGGISPGIGIRFKSLHAFTSKLPLLDITDYRKEMTIDLIGKNTSQAILSGVINGIVAEINGIILRYTEIYPDLKILICGGDANYFESKIKPSIFAIPELVHWGLNRILEHNESEF